MDGWTGQPVGLVLPVGGRVVEGERKMSSQVKSNKARQATKQDNLGDNRQEETGTFSGLDLLI